MSRFLNKQYESLQAYTPGEQPRNMQYIKLNTNENPYPPAPGVKKALMDMDADKMGLYPDPTAGVLVHTLAAYYGVDDSQVFVGVGSDDVLAMCFLTFFNSEKPIFFPDITYSFYKVWAELYRIPYECQKLNDDFCIVKEDYYKENGGVIIANPNAPTSQGATCLEGAMTFKTCFCNTKFDIANDEANPALGHDYDFSTITVMTYADYTKDGVITRGCHRADCQQ